MTGATMRAFHKRAIVTLLALLSLSVVLCNSEQQEDLNAHLSRFLADLWLEGADVVRIIWRDCSKKLVDVKDVIDHKEYFPKFVRCMKRKTLRALDRTLSRDVVPIVDGVNLVKFELVDRSGNVVVENQTSWKDRDLEQGEWRTLALQRMGAVLRTHVIKFDLDGLKTVDKAEYRGRRRHHMMTMMMFGIVSIGMVLIPMGFQFLAVLGGKALLLAKMALILASIQGLKKIATSPVNYGFYHSFPPPPPHPPLPFEHLEKRSYDDWTSPSVIAATSPSTKSIHKWPNLDIEDLKVDRVDVEASDIKRKRGVKTYNEIPKTDFGYSEARLYPVYPGIQPPAVSSLDAPTPLVDLTTTPGEVQADVALEMPYNGFRFQTPTAVVSA